MRGIQPDQVSTDESLDLTEEETERLFYMGTGPLLAILLGMTLVPFRGYTTASNSTFPFLALTIVVAELGGRWPAVGTALASALSLDFFLTQPYLRLTIADKHDVMAFFGLAGCGLVAALLGSRRRERIRELDAARRHLEFLHAALSQAEHGGALERRLAALLDASCAVFPIARAVVRTPDGDVLAASPRGLVGVPGQALELDAQPRVGGATTTWLGGGRSLPGEGGRLELLFDDRQRGWLDVWGDGRPASAEVRRGLADLTRLLALLLATAKANGT